MPACMIMGIDVKYPATCKEYTALAPATVEANRGRDLARAGRTETLERDWVPKRLVILQFESIERARRWVDSPEHAPVGRLRHQARTAIWR